VLKSHGTRLRLRDCVCKINREQVFKIFTRLCVFCERGGEGKVVPVRKSYVLKAYWGTSFKLYAFFLVTACCWLSRFVPRRFYPFPQPNCRRLTPTLKLSVKSSQVKSSQVKSSQVKLSQVKSSQVMSSQVKSSQVKSSQVKSSQVMSSQVKSSQVMSNCECSRNKQPLHVLNIITLSSVYCT
jgi:hypothetical protein